MPTETLTTKLQYVYDPAAHDAAVRGTRGVVAAEEALLKAYRENGAGGEAMAQQTARVSAAQKQLAADLETSRAKADLTRQSMMAVSGALGAMGAGASAVLFMGSKAAAEYGAKITEVGTLSKEAQARTAEFNDQVLKLSASLGKDAVDAANGLYQAISAGIPAENAMSFLATASKAAIAGATDTETAVDGLSTAVNSWKAQGLDAAKASDVMFAGVQVGKMTFEQLSASMFQAAPLASSLGVSIDEVVGATATLTKSGTPASVAMNQVRASMVALLKPNADMEPVLARIAQKFPEIGRVAQEQGISIGEAALKTRGYELTMQDVATTTHEMGVQMVGAMGRIDGANAVLGLTGENAKGAAADLEYMRNSAGLTEGAYAAMSETMDQKSKVFKASMQAAGIVIGEEVQPALMGMMSVGQRVLDWFNNAPGPVKTATAAALAFAAVLGTVGAALAGGAAVFGPTIVAAGGLSAALGILGGTAMTAMAALAPIVLPLAAIAAAFVLITRANANYNKALSEQIGTVDRATGSMSDYEAAAKRAAGVPALNLPGVKEAKELQAMKEGATAYLELSIGVDKATISSSKFKSGLDELTRQHQAGKLSAKDYQDAVVKLADGIQTAAGGTRVLSTEERKTAQAWQQSAEVALRKNDAVRQALEGDEAYRMVASNLAAAVGKGEMAQAAATKTLEGYIAFRSKAIEKDKEAAAATAAAATGQSYSSGFAAQFHAGSVTDDEGKAKVSEDADKAAADGSMQVLGTLWDAQKQYYSDLAKARADDAAAASAAVRKQGEGSAKLASVEADFAVKRASAEERLGKAKTEAQRMSAQRSLDKANEGYAAAISKETEHQGKLGAVITAGGAGNVARVEQQFQELVKVQQTALAQMAVDYIKQQVLIGNTSEATAKRIFGSLSHAFPGVEVINPVEEASLGFLATLHEAAAGSEDALNKLPGTVAAVGDQMQKTADDSKAQAEQWNADLSTTADTAEQADARVVASAQARAGGVLSAADVERAQIQGTAETQIGAAAARQAADVVTMASAAARAGGVQSAADIEKENITGTAETEVAQGERRTAAGAKLTADVATHTGAMSGSLTRQRQDMGQTASEAEAAGSRTASAWGSAASGVASAGSAFAAATGGMRTVSAEAANAIATIGTKGSQSMNQLGAAAVEAYGQQASAAENVTGKTKTVEQAYGDLLRRTQEHGSSTASSMQTAKRSTDEAASATSAGSRTAVSALARQKAAVEALAAAYRKLPKLVSVKVVQVGVEAAQKAIQAYVSDLQKIPRSITTNIKAVYQSASPPATNQGGSLMLQHDLEDVFAVADEHGPIMLQGAYLPSTAAMEMTRSGTLGIQDAVDRLASTTSAEGLVVTMDAEGDPLILPDGSGKMVWQQLVEDFYAIVEKGPALSSGWQKLIDIFFSPNPDVPGSLAHMIASWDPSTLVPDEGLIGKSKERVMEMFALGPEGMTNDELAKWGGQALLDFFNDPAISGAADRIKLLNEALADAQRLILEGDYGGAAKKWKEAYDIAKKAEDDYHQRVSDHLKRTQEIYGESNTGRIGAIVDAEDRRHELAMQNLDAENDGWERMGANWQEFEAARAEALAAARDAIKSAQKAQEDGEKDVHDKVMAAIDDETDRRQRQHDAIRQALEDRKNIEADLHDRASSALDAQALQIKALQDADDARMASAKQGVEALKTALDIEGEKKKLDGLRDAASQFKSTLGKLERVETDPKKALENQRKAAAERVRLSSDEQRSMLQGALDRGQVDAGDQRLVQLLLMGRNVRARDAERVMGAIQKQLEATAGAQGKVVDAKQLEIDHAQHLLDLEEQAAAKRKDARDEQLKVIEALKKAEDDRHKQSAAAIDDLAKAEDRRYSQEKQAIDDLKKTEKERHDARIKQIQDEYALELLKVGKTEEQVKNLLEARALQARQISEEAQRRYNAAVAEIEQTTARLAGESAAADADAVRRTAEAFEQRLRELAALALQIGGEAGAVLAAMLDELLGTALANGTARRGLRVTTGSSDPADTPRRMGDAWSGASARIGSAWSSVEEGFVESVAVMGDAWSGFMAGMNAGGIRPELGAGGSKLPRVNNHGADDDDYWATHRYGDVRHHYADRQKYLKEQAKGDSTTRIQGETSFTKESLEHPITGLVANPGGGAPTPFERMQRDLGNVQMAAEAASKAINATWLPPMIAGLDDVIQRLRQIGVVIGDLPPMPLPGVPGPGQPAVPLGGERTYNQYGDVNYFDAKDAPDEFIDAMLDFVGLGSAP